MDTSRALPTGVVTFLLTDIEGSTRRWENEPEAMREALARHDAVVTTCVRRMNGHVVKSKGEGDSVFAVFRHARDAVTAALVLQAALGAEEWATSTPLRVRMAIHTGHVELRDGDYYGPTVNRCARLRALARGGQVLISGVTAKLVQGQLPNAATLKDLGTHQLKDLSAPERVWQLAHPRLASAGSAPSSDAAPPATRPTQRAYVLTDQLNRTADGRQWSESKRHVATGLSSNDDDGRINCYTSPTAAALLNALNERHRLPRLWEAVVDSEAAQGSATIACREVTTVRQVPLPTLTGKHHARFAVLCARAAAEGEYAGEFSDWAATWLAGQDGSGVQARELADGLERESRREAGIAQVETQMLANAARAAEYASKLSWLVGRARDEENTRAIESASEAVHTALRMKQLDLVALADKAVPQSGVPPLTPTRTPQPLTANRILRALPT